jgi:hypothetical protein
MNSRSRPGEKEGFAISSVGWDEISFVWWRKCSSWIIFQIKLQNFAAKNFLRLNDAFISGENLRLTYGNSRKTCGACRKTWLFLR